MGEITASEKARRHRAVASSVGSLAMEGQRLDAATLDLNRRYVAGELTLDEFSAAIDQHLLEVVRSFHEEPVTVSA